MLEWCWKARKKDCRSLSIIMTVNLRTALIHENPSCSTWAKPKGLPLLSRGPRQNPLAQVEQNQKVCLYLAEAPAKVIGRISQSLLLKSKTTVNVIIVILIANHFHGPIWIFILGRTVGHASKTEDTLETDRMHVNPRILETFSAQAVLDRFPNQLKFFAIFAIEFKNWSLLCFCQCMISTSAHDGQCWVCSAFVDEECFKYLKPD